MNGPSDQRPRIDTLVPVDPRRRALEVRIEHAKHRIVEDLNRASVLVRGVAARAGRGIEAALIVAGLAVAAALIAVLARRRRVRITWR